MSLKEIYIFISSLAALSHLGTKNTKWKARKCQAGGERRERAVEREGEGREKRKHRRRNKMLASCATEQLKWTASCLEHCIQLCINPYIIIYNNLLLCLYLHCSITYHFFPVSLKSVCHFLWHTHILDVTSYSFQLHLWEDSLVFWSRIKYVNNCCMDWHAIVSILRLKPACFGYPQSFQFIPSMG